MILAFFHLHLWPIDSSELYAAEPWTAIFFTNANFVETNSVMVKWSFLNFDEMRTSIPAFGKSLIVILETVK